MITHSDIIKERIGWIDEAIAEAVKAEGLLYTYHGTDVLIKRLGLIVSEMIFSGRQRDKGRLVFLYGEYGIDTVQEVIWGPGGTVVELRPDDIGILVTLGRHPGEPVNREKLIRSVANLQGQVPSSKQLDSRIYRLRNRLALAGLDRDIIMTVPGGYRLKKPFEMD